ncbi:MAG: DUF222 domain-containing protein [bacterium]|nr:DUF222 domain-containing protein [bacterium]
MDFGPSTRHNGCSGTPAGCGAAVCIPAVDEAQMSGPDLSRRLVELGQAESAITALKAKTLLALSERSGQGAARQVAVETLGASSSQARKALMDAERLSNAAETAEALQAGEIPTDHARLIARAASEGPVNEAALVEAARTEDFGKFTRTVRDHQCEQTADGGESRRDRQRQRRTASIRQSAHDGMYELYARFASEAGNRIEAALAAQERSIRTRQDDAAASTFGQRLADALEHLICAEAENRRPQGAKLILTANWDLLNQQMADARLLDGTPLTKAEALRLACHADLLPCVFDTTFQTLDVGRKARSATEAQRAALILRDKHCIGCGKSAAWCETHHIVPWQKGGLTKLDNLVLVCAACHHDIHDRNWAVVRCPDTGRYSLQPMLDPDPFNSHPEENCRDGCHNKPPPATSRPREPLLEPLLFSAA